MADSPSIHYETVATAFQVLDIAGPLVTTAPPDWTVHDVLFAITEDTADYPENWFALIRNDQAILGYVAADFVSDEPGEKYDGPIDGHAGDYCTPITADQIVASKLPLFELIPLFEEHRFFFVLTGNDLTHIVSFNDLDQLPVKLCLFTLITGLESELVRLFTRNPDEIGSYLSHLPEGRLQKAQEECRRQHGEKGITMERILRATNFIDKATMILRTPSLLSRLPFNSKGKAEEFFEQLQELRNRIAHSDTILSQLNTPSAFNQLLRRLRQLTDVVSDLATESRDNKRA